MVQKRASSERGPTGTQSDVQLTSRTTSALGKSPGRRISLCVQTTVKRARMPAARSFQAGKPHGDCDTNLVAACRCWQGSGVSFQSWPCTEAAQGLPSSNQAHTSPTLLLHNTHEVPARLHGGGQSTPGDAHAPPAPALHSPSTPHAHAHAHSNPLPQCSTFSNLAT